MKKEYKIFGEDGTIHSANSMHQLFDILKSKKINLSNVSIKECSDITQFISNILKDETYMASIRSSVRNQLSLFSIIPSSYAEEDMMLPPAFEFLYGIKTEGELAFKLRKEKIFPDDLFQTCLEYGYSMKYLETLEILDEPTSINLLQ